MEHFNANMIIWPLAFGVAYWGGLWLLKRLFPAAAHALGVILLKPERRLLQWLQDRAMARSIGVDLDVLRARRKIDRH